MIDFKKLRRKQLRLNQKKKRKIITLSEKCKLDIKVQYKVKLFKAYSLIK
jgi:hypothetical protein